MMPERISDSELRQRLEDFQYNVPPITDTTRNVLMKKLRQFETLSKSAALTSIDYSSAEEDCGGRLEGRDDSPCKMIINSKNHFQGAVTPKTTIRINRLKGDDSLLGNLNHSEEDDDSDEVDEDSEEKFDDLDESTANGQTCKNSETETRFRGKMVSPVMNRALLSQSYTLKSHHLRKNLDKFGSLNEALSSIPAHKSPQNYSKSLSTKLSSTSPPILQMGSTQPFRCRIRNYGNSMMVSSLIIASAVIFFGFLGYQYLNLRKMSDHKQKIPVCTQSLGERPNLDCIPGHQLQYTTQILEKVLKFFKENQSCQEYAHTSRTTMKNVLQAGDSIEFQDSRAHLLNVMILLKENPQWGIDPWIEESSENIVLRTSERSLYCSAKFIAVDSIYRLMHILYWIIVIFVMMLIIWFIFLRVKKQEEKKEEETQEVYLMLEKVLSLLQENQKIKGGKASFIAINHIRDQLIPPKDRSKKSYIWKEVTKYIRNHESRVREEVQQVHGEEFLVWQWLPDTLPNISQNHQSFTDSSINTRLLSSTPRLKASDPGESRRELWKSVPKSSSSHGWQGSAFNLNKNVLAPTEPPTACLKIRFMFTLPRFEQNWISALKKDILMRCDGAKILHVAVDKESPEGIVYIKTMSAEDAGLVFSCMHGQWYKGKLLTAKYLRSDRYEQRFPDSVLKGTPLSSQVIDKLDT